jgi:hypothetical protein
LLAVAREMWSTLGEVDRECSFDGLRAFSYAAIVDLTASTANTATAQGLKVKAKV